MTQKVNSLYARRIWDMSKHDVATLRRRNDYTKCENSRYREERCAY